MGRGQFDLDHAYDPGPASGEHGWRGWTGTEYARTALDAFSRTDTLGAETADWSSTVIQSDPAADGSATGTIASLSDGASALTVTGHATEDLLHTTGHGDLFTRTEDGAVLDTTLSITGASHAADDLTYVIDADGETTLDGTSVATSGGGVASALTLSTLLTATGNVRDGGFAFAVTDSAASSLLTTTAGATFGSGFDGDYDADGSAVLLFTEGSGGGSTLSYAADGAGGTESTDDPPAWTNNPQPEPGRPEPVESDMGGGDFERSGGTFSSHTVHTVRRSASDHAAASSELRIELPPHASDGEDEADPVVTAVSSAAGGFQESGSYDVLDRTWRLEEGSWSGGETTIVIHESGDEGRGSGGHEVEFLDESRAWGTDRAAGTWSNGTESHADGTLTGFAGRRRPGRRRPGRSRRVRRGPLHLDSRADRDQHGHDRRVAEHLVRPRGDRHGRRRRDHAGRRLRRRPHLHLPNFER